MRAEPVQHNGQVIGYSARLNMVEVEAVLLQPGAPWDLSLGVFKRREKAAAAIRAAYIGNGSTGGG